MSSLGFPMLLAVVSVVLGILKQLLITQQPFMKKSQRDLLVLPLESISFSPLLIEPSSINWRPSRRRGRGSLHLFPADNYDTRSGERKPTPPFRSTVQTKKKAKRRARL